MTGRPFLFPRVGGYLHPRRVRQIESYRARIQARLDRRAEDNEYAALRARSEMPYDHSAPATRVLLAILVDGARDDWSRRVPGLHAVTDEAS